MRRSTSIGVLELVVITALVVGFAAPILLPQEPAAPAKIPVVATLPYLGEIVERVGGDFVTVSVLAKPGQDPHFIEPTPENIVRVSKARLFVENGMQLEGWSTSLLQNAGNAELMPGQRGHCYATNGIVAVEVPDAATLAAGGHVHRAGNPHVWLDPVNLKIAARNVERSLAVLLHRETATLAANRIAFEKELDEATFGKELLALIPARRLEELHRQRGLIPFLKSKKYKGKPLAARAGGFLGRALALGDLKLVTYHRTWSYFESAFGFEVVGTVESKPGVEPSPVHLVRLAELAKEKNARIVLSPPYYPSRNVEGAASRIGAAARILPTQPGESAAAKDLVSMLDAIFDEIEGAAREVGLIEKAATEK
ncbi:MAG: metal ABC transporter substrate-binding protein [Planctomycetota bacterium]